MVFSRTADQRIVTSLQERMSPQTCVNEFSLIVVPVTIRQVQRSVGAGSARSRLMIPQPTESVLIPGRFLAPVAMISQFVGPQSQQRPTRVQSIVHAPTVVVSLMALVALGFRWPGNVHLILMLLDVSLGRIVEVAH